MLPIPIPLSVPSSHDWDNTEQWLSVEACCVCFASLPEFLSNFAETQAADRRLQLLSVRVVRQRAFVDCVRNAPVGLFGQDRPKGSVEGRLALCQQGSGKTLSQPPLATPSPYSSPSSSFSCSSIMSPPQVSLSSGQVLTALWWTSPLVCVAWTLHNVVHNQAFGYAQQFLSLNLKGLTACYFLYIHRVHPADPAASLTRAMN